MKLDRNEKRRPHSAAESVGNASISPGRPKDRVAGALNHFQRAILSAVGPGEGGFAVAEIAVLVGRQPGYDSDRAHSGLIGQECRALERAGLLRRLNAKRPVAWCATGRRALRQCGNHVGCGSLCHWAPIS